MAKKFTGSFPNPGCAGPVHSIFWADDEEGRRRAEEFAQRENRPGFAIYDSINSFRDDATVRCKETVEVIDKISFDIDLKDIEESKEEVIKVLLSWPYPPTELRDSGHGIHGDIIFKESVPVTDEAEAE